MGPQGAWRAGGTGVPRQGPRLGFGIPQRWGGTSWGYSALGWLPGLGGGSLPVTCPILWDVSPCLLCASFLGCFRGDGFMLSAVTVIFPCSKSELSQLGAVTEAIILLVRLCIIPLLNFCILKIAEYKLRVII